MLEIRRESTLGLSGAIAGNFCGARGSAPISRELDPCETAPSRNRDLSRFAPKSGVEEAPGSPVDAPPIPTRWVISWCLRSLEGSDVGVPGLPSGEKLGRRRGDFRTPRKTMEILPTLQTWPYVAPTRWFCQWGPRMDERPVTCMSHLPILKATLR